MVRACEAGFEGSGPLVNDDGLIERVHCVRLRDEVGEVSAGGTRRGWRRSCERRDSCGLTVASGLPESTFTGAKRPSALLLRSSPHARPCSLTRVVQLEERGERTCWSALACVDA